MARTASVPETVLAQACGWDHLLPLLSAGLTSGDLLKTGDELRLACHRAVLRLAEEAVRMAADLARPPTRLDAVAPKLRAIGAGAAVARDLTRDAVAPAAHRSRPRCRHVRPRRPAALRPTGS